MPDVRHVGLNLLYLVPGAVGGTEVYARRLIAALATTRPDLRFTAICGHEAAPVLREEPTWPGNVRVHELPVACADKARRALAEQALLPVAAARLDVDVLHSLGTTHPLALRCAGVVTVHDLIYLHFPQTFPASARLGLRALVGPGARSADRVITGARSMLTDVTEHLAVPAAKVDVVHHGFGRRPPADVTPEAELRDRFGLGDRRVVLCVSAALEHKNLPRLIEACRELDAVLIIAGHPGRDRAALEALPGDHVLTGWIETADLEGLYALATCCAYPSLHEGFGLPVLEAMVRERPLACADATSLPEVAGDAAELFDPLDVTAIRASIAHLLDDPPYASELVRRGRERVKGFSWERAAEGTLASYERALAARQ